MSWLEIHNIFFSFYFLNSMFLNGSFLTKKANRFNILYYGKNRFEWKHKTFSFPFVRYFRILFWDDITIIWDENIVYFFNWEKIPVLDQWEVCLLNFHQQIFAISSQNNVLKYRTKGHEQVFWLRFYCN